MKRIGEVKAILNDQLLLITCKEKLSIEEVVTVFAEISDPKLVDSTGLPSIAYPKGELRVVCGQSEDSYLVERFREMSERKRKITTPSPFQRGLLGLAAQLQPETKEITEEVPGPWSAEIAKEESLGVSIDKVVHVGDPVGRL